MNRKTRLAAVVLLAIGVVAVWFATRSRPEKKLTSLTIGTFSKAYGNLPYYVARHFKWFEDDPALAGVTIKYVEYNDRPSISDAFSTGTLQVLFSGDAPALLCRAQGNDIRAVAVSGNAEQEVVLHPGSAIKTVSNLAGKTLAVQQATSSHYALLKILKANNMGETDVNIVYMTPAEARVAFETKKIDAWAVWAPFVEQQQAAGSGDALVGGDALINSLMSLSNDLIQNHESAARSLVTSIQRAKTWMVSHPQEAQQIAVQELGLDPKVVALAWPKFKWSVQLDDNIASDLQAKIDFLASLDKTRQSKSMDVRGHYVDVHYRTAP